MSEKIVSYCGLNCEICEEKASNNCGGCVATKGHPFHGECQLAMCAIQKKRRFCGECADIPCELLNSYAYDPEHGDDGARIERCNKIKAELVAEARVGVDPVSICGHHCDYCFLGQWCGGCRSTYNCCSFATLFENGICPAVTCVNEKGLDGCYECEELDACMKGYFGVENEYVCKATALFIKRHGKDCYTTTLKKAIDAGEDYPKSFDAKGSVEGALELLESYL